MFPTVIVATARMPMARTQSARTAMNAMRKTLNRATTPIFFEAAARNEVMVSGAPSYTSGSHMWKGTVATLNPKPAMRNTMAMTRVGRYASTEAAAKTFPSSVRLVVAPGTPGTSGARAPLRPKMREMPKRMIAEERTPMMKNFIAAASRSCFRKATRAKVLRLESSRER